MDDSTDLISAIRADSNDSNTPYAVSTADILRYMNWANERLWGLILQTNPAAMQKEVTFSSVADQRAYTPDANVYMKERIVKVEYKETSNDRDYYRLREVKYSSYISNPTNNPSGYVRRSGQIMPVPPIDNSSGTFRVTYEAAPNEIKEKVGTITAVTDTGVIVTSITIDTTDDNVDATNLDFLCITDVYGNSTMLNIAVNSYDSGTGVFNITSHAYETGESIAVGSYVTQGKYSSSTSNLPDLAERYVVAYPVWKCLMRTTASQEKINHFREELVEIEDEIVKSFQEPDKDDDGIVIDNSEAMLQDF